MNPRDSLRFEVDTLARDEWDMASRTFENFNLYQTWDYAAHHSPHSRTRDVIRCVTFQENQPVVMGQLRIKKIPFLGVGVAEMEWGPLWRIESGEAGLEELTRFFHELKEELCGKRKWEVRLYPHSTHPHGLDQTVQEMLMEQSFQQVIDETHNYDTVMIDLSKDLETLRSELHQKWRNLLKKAEKSDLVVESGRDVDHFDRFLRLYEKMRKTKDFPTGVRVPVIREMQAVLPESERFLVSVAVEDGRDVGATVCAMTGTRMLYFLGATDPEYRGSAPGYLLQWRNIQIGKQSGIHWYDLGGLVSEGVSRFKARMGGERVSFPRRFVATPGAWRSSLFEFAEKMIQRIRL